jgi:hypothetical protein
MSLQDQIALATRHVETPAGLYRGSVRSLRRAEQERRAKNC